MVVGAQRVVGRPRATVSSSLVLGSAVHHALAEYHRAVLNAEPIKTQALHHFLMQGWEQRKAEAGVTYRSGEGREECIAQV